nr:MAG TPA: hypothetical protein [Caudoviricetes sp.]
MLSLVPQYSQHTITERSFSRLPTHPYVQWWNAAFATISTLICFPFLGLCHYAVHNCK